MRTLVIFSNEAQKYIYSLWFFSNDTLSVQTPPVKPHRVKSKVKDLFSAEVFIIASLHIICVNCCERRNAVPGIV